MKEYEYIEEQLKSVELENIIKKIERNRKTIRELALANLSLLYSILMLSEVILEISGVLTPSLFLLAYPALIFLISIGFVHFYFKKEVNK